MAWDLRNDRSRSVSALPARLALGAAMVYHGASKLRGDGAAQAGQMFEGVGIRPGKPWAIATGLAEAFAGVAAILGIATRPAALAVLVTQGVAIARVHAPKGYSVLQGGMEYNLALMAIAAGLLVAGPGDISAHRLALRAADGRGSWRPWRRVHPTALAQVLRILA